MKSFFIVVFAVLLITMVAFAFPEGSVLNFNPAYMVYNTKWSAAYEIYFGNKDMAFTVFQPFKNGFAGELGLYSEEATSGLVYSVATKSGNTSFGIDNTLSLSGTKVSVNVGIGVIQTFSQNYNIGIRLPKAIDYVYQEGVNVFPNFEVDLGTVFPNWTLEGFVGVDSAVVNGGVWGNFSFYGAQVYGRYRIGYDPNYPTMLDQKFDAVLQYSFGSMSFGYIYEYHFIDSDIQETFNGFRFSLDW